MDNEILSAIFAGLGAAVGFLGLLFIWNFLVIQTVMSTFGFFGGLGMLVMSFFCFKLVRALM